MNITVMATEPVRPLPAGLRSMVWVVRALAVLGAAALCITPAVFWLSPDWVRSAGAQMADIGNSPVTVDQRALLLGAGLSLPAVGLGLAALWQLWQLFGEYAAGRVFCRTAHRHLRAFAACMLAAAVLAPFLRAALGLALTLGNPPGERLLSLSVSWNDYVAILTGAVLLAIARVMNAAVALAEENDAFV